MCKLSPELGWVIRVGSVVMRREAVVEGKRGLTLWMTTTAVGLTKTN